MNDHTQNTHKNGRQRRTEDIHPTRSLDRGYDRARHDCEDQTTAERSGEEDEVWDVHGGSNRSGFRKQVRAAARGASVAVLGNLDFSRPLLRAARDIALPIAVDLQDVQGLDNPYDDDFLAAADILVMSHERLTVAHEEFLFALRHKSHARLMVLTLGAGGSLALTPEMTQAVHTPAVLVGPTANTTGAGDTFMGALLHYCFSAHQPLAQALTHASAAAALRLAQPPQILTPDAVQEAVKPLLSVRCEQAHPADPGPP